METLYSLNQIMNTVEYQSYSKSSSSIHYLYKVVCRMVSNHSGADNYENKNINSFLEISNNFKIFENLFQDINPFVNLSQDLNINCKLFLGRDRRSHAIPPLCIAATVMGKAKKTTNETDFSNHIDVFCFSGFRTKTPT